MPLTLEPLTPGNFDAVVAFGVAPEQRGFVAPNLLSLAQSKVHNYLIPLTVCVASTPVGFILYGREPVSGRVYIARFMIDRGHQGQGFGKKALHELLAHIRAKHGSSDIYLSLVPGNTVAESMYKDAGFVETGEVDEDDEIVFCLRSEQT